MPGSLGEHGVGKTRPCLERPVVELAVGETGAGDPSLGVDPKERAGAAEVPERARGRPGAAPVGCLRVLELEAEPPVERVVAADAG